MKKLILFVAIVGTLSTTKAQTSDAETDAIINLLGVQKREAVAKLVSISRKDSSTFWKIYDDYLTKNKALAKTRIKLYERTAQSYENMTPIIADSLATQYFKNRAGQEKSLEEYYAKMKAATTPVV